MEEIEPLTSVFGPWKYDPFFRRGVASEMDNLFGPGGSSLARASSRLVAQSVR